MIQKCLKMIKQFKFTKIINLRKIKIRFRVEMLAFKLFCQKKKKFNCVYIVLLVNLWLVLVRIILEQNIISKALNRKL